MKVGVDLIEIERVRRAPLDHAKPIHPEAHGRVQDLAGRLGVALQQR